MAASVGTLHAEMGFTSVVIARFETRTHFRGFDPETELPPSSDPRPAIFLHLADLGYKVFVDFGEVNRRVSIAFFGRANAERRRLQRLLRSELEDSPFFESPSQAMFAAWRDGEARIWSSFVESQPAALRVATEAGLVAIRERLTLREGGRRSGVAISAGKSEEATIEALQRYRLAEIEMKSAL